MSQSAERTFRNSQPPPDDWERTIDLHHSQAVMKSEMRRFLRDVPIGGTIIDAGVGWGWLWRGISRIRPDVRVTGVDFSRANLDVARRILVDEPRVHLVEADIAALPLAAGAADAYWSVQTWQHVPQRRQLIREVNRVLRQRSPVAIYALRVVSPWKIAYRLAGKEYVQRGMVGGSFWLERANEGWDADIANESGDAAIDHRYSEHLFHPEARCRFRWLGTIDSMLSGSRPLIFARQQSWHWRTP